MMKEYRAVLFDFDGTLVDSYGAITASVNHVRSLHGLAALGESEVRRHVGRGMLHLLQHTVPGFDLEVDAARYREHHPSVLRSGTRLLPGAAEVLETFHSHRTKLAVCSNKPNAFTRELVAILGLSEFFTAVLGPDDVQRIKPAPDMLLAALNKLRVKASEALYVGDMVVDIETARGAGVDVWVVPTGSNERAALEAARPDRVLDNLLQLVNQ